MNDITRNNDWIDPMQYYCPNCARPTRQGTEMPMNQPDFRNTPQPISAGPGYPSQQMISDGISPQSAIAQQSAMQPESTSNIEDWELAQRTPMQPAASTELSGLTAIDIYNQPTAINAQSLQYLNGFLLTQLGKRVQVEFLIGSNNTQVRTGTLVGVGANYILINEFTSRNVVACDFYSIKFIMFYQ